MLRVCVFKGRDDVLLICAESGEGNVVSLPPLAPPFTKVGVQAAFRAVGREVTVIETVPGRWTKGMTDAKCAEEGARGQSQRAAEALRTQVLLGSVDPEERDRAKLVAQMQEFTTELVAVKRDIADAAARRRREIGFGPGAEKLERLKRRELSLKQHILALQGKLSELKKERHSVKMAERRAWAERFVDAAREFLDADTFEGLVDAAREDEEGSNDEV